MRTLIFSFLLLASCGRTEEPKETGVDDSAPDSGGDSAVDVTDADGDGFSQEEDCDDNDGSVNPDARETCDGIDNDCDGLFDDEDSNVYGTSTWYLDADLDGYGGDSLSVEACDEPDGYVEERGDCNDLDANSHPGAEEVCDGVDNDCDGVSDEDDAVDALTWFVDDDGDGYGTTVEVVTACDPPAGYALHDGDCDDADPAFHPGAMENDCTDANDYNCDGSVGYDDIDSDGFAACEDCDDTDADVNEDAAETCDGLDNDCDGLIDDTDPSVTGGTTWYGDSDGDGHGGQQFEQVACAAPPGFVAAADDCDDLNAASYPGASEICDASDNDCDGDVDEGVGSTWYQDSDADGYGNGSVSQQSCDGPSGYVSNALDCDDFNAATNPTSYEVCDGADNDCDGDIDEGAINASTWYVDGDGDGYGTMASTVVACDQPSGHAGNATDCDDVDSAVNPGATEACDGTDNDCDGLTDEDDALDATTWYADLDSDGYGNAGSTATACSQPPGHVADNTDCDDTSATSTTVTTDADCDTVLTADDCNDSDANSTTVATDADCDTVLTADDCNDADSTSTTVATDADCDTVLTADDCNDLDNTLLAIANDADCDGTVTADDCNDGDASIATLGSSQSCPGQSCLDLLNYDPTTGDGSYWIDPESDGSGAFEVYCDMTTDSGGWTLVLMTKESDQTTFRYDSQYWTTSTLLNETTTDPSADTNMKNLAYNTLSFTEIRLDMTSLGNSLTISSTQSSAHAIFTGPHHDPGLTRTEYLDWIDQGNSSWDNQANCNVKGFQVGVGQQWSCRFGINMNNEGSCGSNDAAVGFGCHTQNYSYARRVISCGGFRWSPDIRYDRKGWIFVR